MLVHNKLNSTRLYVESKQTYNGPGKKARSNATILTQGYYAETLKHVIRRTKGKKYITGGGERSTSKTCCYCRKWNPKLDVADKTYRCANPKCKKEYLRDPGSCTLNIDEAAQIQFEKEKAEERERERAAQDEQEQAEAEGQRRSQRLRVQRNQSEQHSV